MDGTSLMNQKPNGWNGSSTRSRNTFPTIYASQHWIVRMTHWLRKPKIHQSSRETGFSLPSLLYVLACRRRLSVIAASPHQPILSTGSSQLYFRLCEHLFLPLEQSGKCSYFGRTYCLELYQDEAAYAWPSIFQTDYQSPLYSGL